MKQIILLILFIGISQFLSAQITPNDAAQSLMSAEDKTAIERTSSFFSTADNFNKDAEAIEAKNEKYDNAKKKAKWEKKVKEAKKLRAQAQIERNKGYKIATDIYVKLIETGTFYFEEDQSMANENKDAAKKLSQKADRYVSKYEALSESQFKKIAFQTITNDIEKSEEAYRNILLGLEDALYVLQEQENKKQITEADNMAWQGAEAANSVDGYLNYIKNFPSGMYADDAQQKLNDIKDAQAQALEAQQNAITYKVQILASKKEWKKNRVAKLYAGVNEKEIEEWFDDEDKFFKYSTGQFSSYNEALSLRNSLNTTKEGVFVIAFKRDFKIDIIEARTLTNELE